MLQQMTKNFIGQIDSDSFFQSIGQPIQEDVVLVRNWDEAISSFRREDWNSLYDTGSSHMVELVQEANWNDRMKTIRDYLDPIAWQLLESPFLASLREEQRKRIVDEARNQLISCCIELETSSLHRFRLFQQVANWLLKGHFACGWDGHYPTGKMVVY